MTVWCVFRRSVYRHELAGIFSSKEKAKLVIDELLKTEPDERHFYELSARELDLPCPRKMHSEFPPDVGLFEPESERFDSLFTVPVRRTSEIGTWIEWKRPEKVNA